MLPLLVSEPPASPDFHGQCASESDARKDRFHEERATLYAGGPEDFVMLHGGQPRWKFSW